MSDDFYYPTLDPQTMKNISVIQKLAAEHPSYWLTAPYSGEIQLQLEGMFFRKKASEKADKEEAELPINDDRESWQFLYEESRNLYINLKNAKPTGDDPAAQMGYFRTATSLLEKLLSMSERANNLKQVSDFYALVMDIMEGVMSPTQRTEVMERLQAATKGN